MAFWETATTDQLEAGVAIVVAAVRTFPDKASLAGAITAVMADEARARTFMVEVERVVQWGALDQ